MIALKYALFQLLFAALSASAQRATTSLVQASLDAIALPAQPAGEYAKARTQFDGIVSQNSVTYLNVHKNSTNNFQLSGANPLNLNLDFTVQFWFKLAELPTGNDEMQILLIHNTLQCYLDSQGEFTCQAAINQRMTAKSTKLVPNKWFYFILSANKNGVAYLLILDNNQIVARGASDNYQVQQSRSTGWFACFGSCVKGMQGFEGGVREFYVAGLFLLPQDAVKNKNSEIQYSSETLAYYRIQGYDKSALNDQFSDKPLNYDLSRPIDDVIGQDFIPADVCPPTFDTQTFYYFDGQQGIASQKLRQRLNQTSYAYTVDIIVNVDPNTCFTNNIEKAKSSCNIVLLDGVFMIYFQQKNMARIHFFSHKSYYESQSSLFFVPFNSWVSIQMTMSQFGGWQVVLLNLQTGETLVSLSQTYNMQRQFPSNGLSLFTGMVGIASNFTLFDQQIQLPIKNPKQTPLVKIPVFFRVTSTSRVSSTLQDQGRNRGNFTFIKTPTFVSASIVFNDGDIYTPAKFDGITCEDLHRNILLHSNTSTLMFQTPTAGNITSENTVEFWFKTPFNPQTTSAVFAMTDTRTNIQYWQVLANQTALTIFPSSNNSESIQFSEFNYQNEDFFGWWHLSCTYQLLARCTLYNSGLEVTYSSTQSFSFPNVSLIASFGNSYTIDKPVGVIGLAVKHFRYWSRAISQTETQSIRQRQADPTVSEGLLVNLRFDRSELFQNSVLQNSNPARLQGTKVTRVNLVSDFKAEQIMSYNASIDSVQYSESKLYHAVCPYNTYPIETYCFNQPVNQAYLSVFPLWDGQTLSWVFSLAHSSLLSDSLMPYLMPFWQSENPFLQQFFALDQTEVKIAASLLHQESKYSLTAGFTNPQSTFQESQKIEFLPNQCRWFEVYNADAQNGRLELNQAQGLNEISFQLQLKQNPSLNCAGFNFYDQFNGLDFQFITSNSSTKITDAPKLQVQVLTLGADSRIEATKDFTSKNLFLNITIPTAEQGKLPLWTDIKILMTVNWKSSQYGVSPAQNSVFQNVLYTVKFAPQNNDLQVVLTQNKDFVTIGQPFVLNASETTVSNIPTNLIQKGMRFRWICPENLTSLCQFQTGSVLAITWDSIIRTQVEFSKNYTFSVEITWVGPSKAIQKKTASVQVVWHNTTLPQFSIAYTPKPILFTSSQNTRFSIQPANFNLSNLVNFEIQWKVQPALVDQDAITYINGSQIIQVKEGSWSKLTNYSISAHLSFKNQSTIQATHSVSFSVFGPPTGGSVSLTPMIGSVGDAYSINVSGWISLSKTQIYYSVYTTIDSSGVTRGAQVNQQPVTQNNTFNSKYTSTNPLQIVVSDLSGEQVQVIVTPQIQPSQTQPDNTTTNGSNSTNETVSLSAKSGSGKGRKLQKELNGILESVIAKGTYDSTIYAALLQNILETNITQTDQLWAEQALQVYDLIVQGKFGQNYFQTLPILDLLIQRIQSNPQQPIKEQIAARLSLILEPIVYEGTSLTIQSKQFNSESAASQEKVNVTAQDATYLMDSEVLFGMMAVDLDHNFDLQVFAIRNELNKTEVSLRIVDSVSKQSTELSELSGRVDIAIAVDPEIYKHGQTVCQTNIGDNWSSETCLTELQVDMQQVQCTCNMIGASQIRLHDDLGLPSGDVVQFPSVVLNQRKLNAQIRGFSYFFISLIAATSLFGLIGSAVFWQKDRAEFESRNSRKPTFFETDIITAVAKVLGQPKEQVQSRHQAILDYYFSDYSPFRHVFFAIHPLISAFSTFNAQQSRFLRFSAYQLQINLYVIGCIVTFGSMYRKRDILRSEHFLDGVDLAGVNLVTAAGLVWLLPIVSEPLCQLLQDKITLVEGQATMTKQRAYLRVFFTISCLFVNLLTILVAVHQCLKSPASNQYLMAWSLVGGTLGATCLSNMLRVVLCCCLRDRFPILTSEKSRQIMTDIQAVLKAKQDIRAESGAKTTQETLKDNDESSESQSHQDDAVKSHQIEMYQTETKRSEVPDSSRLSFVAMQRTAFTVKKQTITNELF